MKLIFLGTKGYIEESSKKHKMHTSTLISYKNTRILIDCGQDWADNLNRLKKYNPDAILITHAHPDHAWGLKGGSPYPVYASKVSLKVMHDYEISDKKKNIVKPYKKFKIKDLSIELFPVQHSLTCPGNGYKIKAGKVTIFYSGDLVYIKERTKALKNVDCYIGEASSLSIPMIRKKDPKDIKEYLKLVEKDKDQITDGELLFGHATIKSQITWCEKADIPKAIFTHCGKEIVQMGYKNAAQKLKNLGKEKNVDVLLAFDGMTKILR